MARDDKIVGNATLHDTLRGDYVGVSSALGLKVISYRHYDDTLVHGNQYNFPGKRVSGSSTANTNMKQERERGN